MVAKPVLAAKRTSSYLKKEGRIVVSGTSKLDSSDLERRARAMFSVNITKKVAAKTKPAPKQLDGKSAFLLAVEAGIFTPEGKLADSYR